MNCETNYNNFWRLPLVLLLLSRIEYSWQKLYSLTFDDPKIFSVEQTRQLDQATIQHEPISSLDLMERASRTFCQWFTRQFSDRKTPVRVCCGPGNNGGDGLAIARLLSQDHYEVKAYLLAPPDRKSVV